MSFWESSTFTTFIRSSNLRQGIDAANAAVKPGEIDYITRSRIEATENTETEWAEEHQMGKCLVNGWI